MYDNTKWTALVTGVAQGSVLGPILSGTYATTNFCIPY